ncbi:hypothetical protein N7517_004862 [Penicillium concentricum]|uniref:Zn(2)-C6 fungal-type domain-containing protein n=1 Tax=Penicillium concentricum TaxID=293559 RepID=A0A9W9S6C4_9EURO|nr:uncharacterized protein N7517_004862 [Penicillium concentricum]KAJ5372856.1 hypothetical protein N7517_004862 [Penicillium concentricum]
MRANTSHAIAQPESRLSPRTEPTSGDGASSTHRVRRRNRVIHSCLECRRRKIKCGRGDPCENCLASGEQCIYVNAATTDAQFQQRLKDMKEAKDAIEDGFQDNIDCETIQQEVKGSRRKRPRHPDEVEDDLDTSADEGLLEPTPLAVHDAAYADEADDDVHDLGFRIGRMRLGERIGGLYRPRIADELYSSLQYIPKRSSRFVPPPVVSVPAKDLLGPGLSFTAPSPDFIFSLSSIEPLLGYIPHRNVADKLLEQYWVAVHPIVRILHRPSFAQRYETLWEAIENGEPVAPSLVALVYSVLFSAVISMSEGQVQEVCRDSREQLRNSLKLGVEASLGRAQLLRSTKIETLQAFVAYLMPMCIDEISRAHTVLAAMAIRLAECMGLHRDPSEYGFSSVECQIRRLIWYQICYLDLKTSEIQGPRPSIHHDGYTTQLPFYVTLSQSSSPNAAPTWKDMIFSSIRFECQEMHRKCLMLRTKVDQKKISLSKAISEIEAFRGSMDAKYGPYLNAVTPSPIQRAAQLVMKLLTNLLYLIPLHRYMNSVTYRIPDRLRQIVLTKGAEALEAAVELQSAEDLKQWSWYSGAYQQYHSALLLLVEVFTYPMRRVANRIWHCLDFIFEAVLTDIPSLGTDRANPMALDIIGHRDLKARYLLNMICDRMRAYQKAKGLKNPVRFNDSMFTVTPQKLGDATDPRMPLNYAHGEPGSGPHIPDLQSTLDNPVPPHGEVNPDMSYSSSEIPGPRIALSTGNPQAVGNLPNAWASSTRKLPLPLQYGEDSSTKFRSSCLRSYASSATQNENMPTNLYFEAQGGTDSIDPQMLEIDWSIWDSIFPPETNDGNLDIPGDSM